MAAEKGFFVDWNGKTRRTEAPGDGLRCEVAPSGSHVDVINQEGCHIYGYG